MSLAEIYTGQTNEEHKSLSGVIVRPSILCPKHNRPSNKDEESVIRAAQAEIYRNRHEQGQDIWTGQPLDSAIKKLK